MKQPLQNFLKNFIKNKIIGNRITLSKHLDYLSKKNIILWDRGVKHTEEGYIIKRQGLNKI